MRRLIMGIAAAFVAAASGVTLDELNVARDPENLDGAIFGTTLCALNLRSGPGLNFPSIGTVPEGAQVPILGWLERDYEDGFWFRTQYEGKKGWLCSLRDGTRLVERGGGPIFKVTVAVDKLKFNWLKDAGRRQWEDIWLSRGEELEFLAVWGNEAFSPESGYFPFFVKYGEKAGYVYAYGSEKFPLSGVEPPPGRESAWFVACPPELLDSSLIYYRDNPRFEFVGPEERRGYYSGPGFDYDLDESVFLHGGIFFLEGSWALVWSYNEWSWVYVGTEEEPNVQMTINLAEGVFPPADNAASGFAEGGVGISLRRDYWPSTPRLYIELHAPYFCDCKEDARVDALDIYQPPYSDVPVFLAAAGEGVDSWWHETYLFKYELTMPDSVDLGAPFRAVARVHYEGGRESELEFLCNAGE